MGTAVNSNFSSPWSFLWQVIKPYRWWYALMLQAPIFTAFYVFANNYSFKLLIDAFSQEHIQNYGSLLWPILLFITAQITLDLFWRLSDYAEWKAEPYARQRLLSMAYDYIQHHSFTFFQNTPGGTVVSRLKGILDGYDSVFSNIHHIVGKHFCVVLVSIFVLLLVNVTVFWFMLGWTVLVLILMLPMALKLNRYSNKGAESKHRVMVIFADNIAIIFSLFYFAKGEHEDDRIDDLLSKDFVARQVDLFMLHLRIHGTISTGDFLFVMLTSVTISFDLWTLMGTLCTFLKEMGDFKSSFTLLQQPQEKVDTKDATAIKIKAGKISFEQVGFAYDAHNVIFSELNLKIKPGEKIGLVGHSGAGKSTLISLLLKNFNVNSGEIYIDDYPISKIHSDSLRAQISLIPQDIMLFHRTIGENIGYAKEGATVDEIRSAAKMANLDKFIESLPQQYDTLVGERGVKLSGGQRQRIAIARAFLKNAAIVILDEATSSLDSLSEQEIQQSINSMLEENKATVIAIAHRLSTIRHMDRIVVMEHGTIIEEGSFEELVLIQNGYFKKLWDSQVNGMVV